MSTRASGAVREPLDWDQALRWGGRNVVVLLAGVLPSAILAAITLGFIIGEHGGMGTDTLTGVAYLSLLLVIPAFPVAAAYVAVVLSVARRNPDAGRAVAILLPATAVVAGAAAMAWHPLLVSALLGACLACGAAVQLDPGRTLGEVEWVWLTELSLAMLVMLFAVVPA